MASFKMSDSENLPPTQGVNGEKMALQRLFETIFDLRGKVRVEGGQRNIFIERNQKQENVMRKLELALEVINRMGIKDTNKLMYNFKLV